MGSRLGSLGKILDSGLPEAVSLLKEAVEVGEKVLPGSVLLADAYDKLAHNYSYGHSMVDLNQALEYCDKALNLRMTCLGEQHLSTAKTYYSIGMAYFIFEKDILAIPYFEKSIGIMLNCSLEEADLLIIKSYRLLGDIYEELGDYSNALECYEEALSFVSKLPEAKKEVRSFYIGVIEDEIKNIQEELPEPGQVEDTK